VIVIDNILVSDDVVQKRFVCDLTRCRGGCCEEGDAGAPLETAELETILEVYDKVEPYLSEASRKEIARKGKYLYNREFGWVTPTLGSDREICVYANRDKNGVIKCAFEEAFNDGVIGWKKPISCHLFPVIAEKGRHGDYEKVNYEPREKLCNPACALGKKLEVPVYEFLREPLTRKYGEAFYNALDHVARRQAEAWNNKTTRKA
jgi:hypothetical protein